VEQRHFRDINLEFAEINKKTSPKYHRWLCYCFAIPLFTTILTGIVTIAKNIAYSSANWLKFFDQHSCIHRAGE
jgi:hypothetical protein